MDAPWTRSRGTARAAHALTTVYIGGERWHVIEFPEVLCRRWLRALDRGEFFPIRYAGTARLVNPYAVALMASEPRREG